MPIGLDIIGFIWRVTLCHQEHFVETMRTALKNGRNSQNASEFYSSLEYNSLVSLERYFEKHPEDVENVVISINGALNLETHTFKLIREEYVNDGNLEGGSLSELKSPDYIEDAVSRGSRFPRFEPGNFEANLRLVKRVRGITKTTVSLSRRPVERANENSRVVYLTDEELARIDATLPSFTAAGGRYNDTTPIIT
ncbi:NADP-dependent oxidoreductase domain-containing protein [Xylaria digitata]|nr:NADP-dependent oxidoreductase domain-containing protein [Xylaria digitata]